MKFFIIQIFMILSLNLFSQIKPLEIEIKTQKIIGDTFIMGSPPQEKYRSTDEKQHKVILSDFSISQKEICYTNYIHFLNQTGISSNGSFKGTEYIDIDDYDCAIKFINGSFKFTATSLVPDASYAITEVTWAGALAFPSG